MAKIDVSKIDGYADMTAEEKLAALEGYELPEADYTGWVKKDTFDKTASEAAKNKKDARETSEKLQQALDDIAQLKKASAVSQYTAKLLAQGYAEELAADTAQAMADGDVTKVLENQKTFVSELEKKVKAEMLKGTPKPTGGKGSGTDAMTLAKLRGMSPADRHKFSVDHPEEYKALYGG